MSETDKKQEESKQADIFILLTTQIDPDIEAYLRGQGLSWFFKRRQKFQRFLEKQEDDKDAN